MDTTAFLSTLESFSPWNYVLTLAVACGVNATVQWLLRPRHHPPFYCEFPYIPWLGSLVQFATQPREFLQRAADRCGPVFTIQLFGKKMTFLFGTDGHAHFFRAKEHVFDIREACEYSRRRKKCMHPIPECFVVFDSFSFALPCPTILVNPRRHDGHHVWPRRVLRRAPVTHGGTGEYY